MSARARTRVLLPVAVLLASCGTTADPVQVLQGRVAIGGLAGTPVEVQAIHDGQLASAAPLEHGGAFVLAVPTGDPVSLALVDREGAAVAWLGRDGSHAAYMLLCSPGEVVDLGVLEPVEGACLQSDACRSATALRAECLAFAARACSALEPEVSACLDERVQACIRTRLALRVCEDEHGDSGCERERYLAATCDGAPTCEELTLTYWSRCGLPCSGLEALVGRICSACERPDLVFARSLPPEGTTCEAAP